MQAAKGPCLYDQRTMFHVRVWSQEPPVHMNHVFFILIIVIYYYLCYQVPKYLISAARIIYLILIYQFMYLPNQFFVADQASK